MEKGAAVRLANELVGVLMEDMARLIPTAPMRIALARSAASYGCRVVSMDEPWLDKHQSAVAASVRRCIVSILAFQMAIHGRSRRIHAYEFHLKGVVAKYAEVGNNLSAWGPLCWFVTHHMAMYSIPNADDPAAAQFSLHKFVSRFPYILPCAVCRGHVVALLAQNPPSSNFEIDGVPVSEMQSLFSHVPSFIVIAAYVALAWTLHLRAEQKKMPTGNRSSLNRFVFTTITQNHP